MFSCCISHIGIVKFGRPKLTSPFLVTSSLFYSYQNGSEDEILYGMSYTNQHKRQVFLIAQSIQNSGRNQHENTLFHTGLILTGTANLRQERYVAKYSLKRGTAQKLHMYSSIDINT